MGLPVSLLGQQRLIRGFHPNHPLSPLLLQSPVTLVTRQQRWKGCRDISCSNGGLNPSISPCYHLQRDSSSLLPNQKCSHAPCGAVLLAALLPHGDRAAWKVPKGWQGVTQRERSSKRDRDTWKLLVSRLSKSQLLSLPNSPLEVGKAEHYEAVVKKARVFTLRSQWGSWQVLHLSHNLQDFHSLNGNTPDIQINPRYILPHTTTRNFFLSTSNLFEVGLTFLFCGFAIIVVWKIPWMSGMLSFKAQHLH